MLLDICTITEFFYYSASFYHQMLYVLNISCNGNKLHTSFLGAIAQLGEHLLCKQEVVGSIPTSSTENLKKSQ